MTESERGNKAEKANGSGISAFGIVAILIMLGLLGWAGWYAVNAWNAMSGVKISPLGWIFMALGAVVTFLLGAGLMALIFYSSRHDIDH
jgi:TRAP-type C4-dicarboxylate transport system permease small subunit